MFAERYRVIRYDTRGFGKTDTEDVEFSNRDDAAALMDHLGVHSRLLHRVRLGKRTMWRFELSLGNGAFRHMVISEDDVDPKSKTYLMADLPASVKAELESAYKAATQRRGGQPPRTRVSAVPN